MEEFRLVTLLVTLEYVGVLQFTHCFSLSSLCQGSYISSSCPSWSDLDTKQWLIQAYYVVLCFPSLLQKQGGMLVIYCWLFHKMKGKGFTAR